MELKNELELKLNARPIEANPGSSPEPSPGPSSLESPGSGPSPVEPSPDPSSSRPRNAKGHKPECVCTLCKRIQARIARGEPSQAEVREQRKQQREQKQREQQKQRTTLLSRKRQEREAQQTALEASIETQARLGHKPNVALAGEIVGMDPRRAQQVSQAEGFVEGALSRAGITDAKLAEVASEGIDAMIQRIVTDRDGNIIDVINTPDWKNRHAFWSDLLRIKRILGSEQESGGGSGGLIIITPDMAKVLPGHPPACTCDGCLRAWEDKTAHLRRAAMKERAIIAEVLPPNSERSDSSRNIDWRQDPDAVEVDDFTRDESQSVHPASRSASHPNLRRPTTDRVSNISRDGEHDEYDDGGDDFGPLD